MCGQDGIYTGIMSCMSTFEFLLQRTIFYFNIYTLIHIVKQISMPISTFILYICVG